MGISVRCGDCGRNYNLEDRMAGKKVKCKACGNVFEVPAAEHPAPAAPAPPPRQAAKVCTVCGQDLANIPSRVKDPEGRYYCKACYDAASVQAPPPVPPAYSAAAAPPPAYGADVDPLDFAASMPPASYGVQQAPPPLPMPMQAAPAPMPAAQASGFSDPRRIPLPTWLAPIIGAIIGGAIAMKAMDRSGEGLQLGILLIGVVGGGLAGMVVVVMDWMKKSPEQAPARQTPRPRRSAPSSRGSDSDSDDLTAIDWVLIVIFPCVGLIIGLIRAVQGKRSGGKMIALSLLFCAIWAGVRFVATGLPG